MNTLEKEIFTLINNHRQQHGLPALQPSVNLAYVAHTHAMDVVENNPDVNGGNMHSWSDKGKWKPVTYTSDHRYASLMWSKPSEISNYKFNGFEISFGYGKNVRKTMTLDPNRVVESWKNSPGHNDVMVQSGGFSHMPMKAMGAGVYKGYACVWFGHELDTYSAPNGTPKGKEPNEFSGNYQLLNVQSNKVLDIYGKGTDDGTNVQIFGNHGGENQIWVIHANQDGTVKLINPHSGKVLDVYGSGTSDGTNVQIFTDNGSNAQKWHVQGIEGGKYKLINVGSSKALDVTSSGTSDGTNVQMWSDNGTPAQQWQLIRYSSQSKEPNEFSGNYQLLNVQSNKVLDIYGKGTDDGTNVQIFGNHGGENQIWVIHANQDGTVKLINPHSGKVLDVYGSGTSDGTNVQIFTDNGSNAQKWHVQGIEGGKYKLINVGSSKALDVTSSGTSDGTNVQMWSDNALIQQSQLSVQLQQHIHHSASSQHSPRRPPRSTRSSLETISSIPLLMNHQQNCSEVRPLMEQQTTPVTSTPRRPASDSFDNSDSNHQHINQNIAQQQILKTIPATVGFSSILYHHCQRATYDIRFTVRSLEQYQTALELGRLSIGHSRTLKISHRKLL
ncbi:unnamed protein product [Rotaria magnacalcarata]